MPPDGAHADAGCAQVCETFDDIGLREDLLRGIFAYGFEKPSAIQQRGTLPLIKGRDTIAQVRHKFPFCSKIVFSKRAAACGCRSPLPASRWSSVDLVFASSVPAMHVNAGQYQAAECSETVAQIR